MIFEAGAKASNRAWLGMRAPTARPDFEIAPRFRTMRVSTLDPQTRDLSPYLMEAPGKPKIIPAGFYQQQTTMQERAVFGHRNGLYCLPTTELISWLKTFIAGRTAMEIGAGCGAISAALGIRATDNKHQIFNEYSKAAYELFAQPVVTYGRHVETMDANTAVRTYPTQVVIASWLTHRCVEGDPTFSGNPFGVDEADIIENCEAYVFIGNRETHANKPILKLPHESFEPDWLISRSMSGAPEFIGIWRR
jgi:hypothetical protein